MRYTKPPRATELWIPATKLAEPREGYAKLNRHWVADEDDNVLFVRGHGWNQWVPQCNHDSVAVEMIISKLYPGRRSFFIPLAFLGHDDENTGFAYPRKFEREQIERRRLEEANS